MRGAAVAVGSKCPFLNMNPSLTSSYMLNFAGQCPFLSMVNAQGATSPSEYSRPITSTAPVQEPLATQQRVGRMPLAYEFEVQDQEDQPCLPECEEVQRSVEKEIEKEFLTAKRNGHRMHQSTNFVLPQLPVVEVPEPGTARHPLYFTTVMLYCAIYFVFLPHCTIFYSATHYSL